MADTINLLHSLTPKGEIVLIGENTSKSYVIIMNNVTDNIESLNIITNDFLSLEFPILVSETLENGVYKLNRAKE